MDVRRRARRADADEEPQRSGPDQGQAATPKVQWARIQNQARRLDQLEKQAARDGQRIAELEAELQESRRLNKRIAELTDVVAQVLLPADQRDDARIASRLTDVHRALQSRTDPS